MNPKAGKKSNGHVNALCRHKHFKGDCNDAARKGAKKEIEREVSQK
jgi:hypothetical protein